jgi:hypothetical protein
VPESLLVLQKLAGMGVRSRCRKDRRVLRHGKAGFILAYLTDDQTIGSNRRCVVRFDGGVGDQSNQRRLIADAQRSDIALDAAQHDTPGAGAVRHCQVERSVYIEANSIRGEANARLQGNDIASQASVQAPSDAAHAHHTPEVVHGLAKTILQVLQVIGSDP